MDSSNKQTYYIELSEEIQTLLLDNDIDLAKEIQKYGLDVSASWGSKPCTENSIEGAKSTEMVLLAMAAILPSIAYSITKIINAVSNNQRVLVKQGQYVPMVDASGKQAYSQSGQPMFQWREEIKYVEPEYRSMERESATFSLDSANGLKIQFSPEK